MKVKRKVPKSVTLCNFSLVSFLPLKLLEQIKTLEQEISQQSGEREELIGQLDKITEDHTSSSQNTETMVGKIQVRGYDLSHM